MSTAPGSNLQNSTGDKAEAVPPLPKDGTRGRMWSEVWKLWSWPRFPALLIRKTAAAHEVAIQEVSTRSTPTVNAAIVINKPQAVINAPARSRILKSPSAIRDQPNVSPPSTPLHKLRNTRAVRRKTFVELEFVVIYSVLLSPAAVSSTPMIDMGRGIKCRSRLWLF